MQKSTGRKVAIKRMENIFDDETDCKRILREITLMRKLRGHPFIVELVEILYPADPDNFTTLYVVMEHAESDLKKIIKSNIHLENEHIQTIIYNLLCAIKFLHESNVLHRDLKPANVLINEDCTVKLCDFGLARSTSGVKSAEIILSNVDVERDMDKPSLGKKAFSFDDAPQEQAVQNLPKLHVGKHKKAKEERMLDGDAIMVKESSI